MKKFFGLMMVVVLTALILTACGPKQVTISAEMNEFAFTPNTWTVPANSKVTLNLSNTGTLEHEYVIMLLGQKATVPFDDDDEPKIYWEKELVKGESMAVEFTAPDEPGTYQIVCGTAGHLEAGMEGTLIVTE